MTDHRNKFERDLAELTGSQPETMLLLREGGGYCESSGDRLNLAYQIWLKASGINVKGEGDE